MSARFPAAAREKGIAMASATNWLFNALVAGTLLAKVVEGVPLHRAGHRPTDERVAPLTSRSVGA